MTIDGIRVITFVLHTQELSPGCHQLCPIRARRLVVSGQDLCPLSCETKQELPAQSHNSEDANLAPIPPNVEIDLGPWIR